MSHIIMEHGEKKDKRKQKLSPIRIYSRIEREATRAEHHEDSEKQQNDDHTEKNNNIIVEWEWKA